MGSPDAAQPDADLIYRLRALPNAAAVLHVGAHPDDEETGTIAYLSRGLGLRTVYWSATRGEGGQNRQGSERGAALGIVRTWESLEAREVDGGEVLYGPFYDFGFSKSADAAFSKWDRHDLVREVARAIRLVQPLVVIGRWSGGPSDGHGQHQAVGAVMTEAFEAAASADRFPELDRIGLPPWRARKLYRSMLGDWQPGEEVSLGGRVPAFEREPDVLRVDTGAFDPISGRTYHELAALGRNRHRTQAMAELPGRGASYAYYRLERSLVDGDGTGVLDGLDPTLTGLPAHAGVVSSDLEAPLAQARLHAEAAIRAFHPASPGAAGEEVLLGLASLRTAATLVAGDGATERALRQGLGRAIAAFEDAARRCFGLRLDATVEPRRAVPGDDLRVTVRLWSPGTVEAVELAVRAPDAWTVERSEVDAPETGEPAAGVTAEAAFEVRIPDDAEVSTPYWLRGPIAGYRYPWPEGGPCALPFDPALVAGTATLTIRGEQVSLHEPASSRETFVGGYRELPMAVLPPMALQPREERVLLPLEASEREVELQVSARATREQGTKGDLVAAAPTGWTIRPPDAALLFPRGGESKTLSFSLAIPPDAQPGGHRVAYDLVTDRRRPGLVVQPVWQGAPSVRRAPDETTCIAEAFLAAPAAITVDLVDVAFVRTLRYGYVVGADEQVVPSLSRFGLDLSELSEEDLSYGDLGAFDAIVVGPNAYLARDAVRSAAPRLLEYVELGGTLLVEYQAYTYQADGLAPYPFRYEHPHARVTFPDVPVTLLDPDHPLLRVPNQITERDFDGWVHDRGLYFWSEWDRRYVPLLECHDPGEGPQRGGLLVAGFGQGTYAYTGYSLFRQIPAGVAGAIRLFANLLGLAETRMLERIERARRVELFSFMSDDQLRDVVRLMSERWFEDGAYLARQGDTGNELFLIVEGEVEVVRDGVPTTHVARRGEAVGELAIVADTPRSASLRTRGGTKVLSMRGDRFRRLLREHRDLADGLIRLLATRLAGSGP